MKIRRESDRGQIPALWLVVGLIVGILILGDLTRRMTDARRLEIDARTLSTEVARLDSENIALETQIAGVTSEASVAEWARGEAMMVREGEQLVVPLPDEGQTVTQTPVPEGGGEPPSNLLIWWALLTGG